MTQRIGFFLARLFPLYVLVLATDVLRLANKYAGHRVFDWTLISDEGAAVEASNGIQVDCDASLRDKHKLSHAFLIAGDDQTRSLTPHLRRWIRHVRAEGTLLGAIDSGAFLLAECRMLRGHRITLHPLGKAAFRERYPKVRLVDEPYVRDGDLLTCAGGVATVALMLHLTESAVGPAIARSVAGDLVLPVTFNSAASRTGLLPRQETAVGTEHVIELMHGNIEEPLSLQTLAIEARVSARQLTRLFRKDLRMSPMTYYRSIRLNHARQLLFQSDLSISEIAIATGFGSLSSFSRRFHAEFGHSPRKLLASLRKQAIPSTIPLNNPGKRLRFS